MNRILVGLVALTFCFALAAYPAIGAEPEKEGVAAKSKSDGQPNIIKYSPGMRVSSLAGRPDTDTLELPSGRRMSLGDARRLEAGAQKIRGARRGAGRPAALTLKPAATGTPIKTGADLAAALKRPDGDTVQLPNGKLVTVAQLKFAKPLVENRLGRKLAMTAKRPNLSGPAVKVSQNTTKAQWIDLLKRPDSTVLESSNGRRITVGELKQYMAEKRKSARAYKTGTGVIPQKSTPAVAPKQR